MVLNKMKTFWKVIELLGIGSWGILAVIFMYIFFKVFTGEGYRESFTCNEYGEAYIEIVFFSILFILGLIAFIRIWNKK